CDGSEALFWLFLAAELLRENKRMLDKSIREIERERQGLQTQEKKLIAEIKKTAKQGQMVSILYRNCLILYRSLHEHSMLYELSILVGYYSLQAAVKVMAKDLIRTRHQITKFYALKSQLQGVSLRIQVKHHLFTFFAY
ncbi:hypothetical protein GW17_00041803, partial [Ensete ventricosum]